MLAVRSVHLPSRRLLTTSSASELQGIPGGPLVLGGYRTYIYIYIYRVPKMTNNNYIYIIYVTILFHVYALFRIQHGKKAWNQSAEGMTQAFWHCTCALKLFQKVTNQIGRSPISQCLKLPISWAPWFPMVGPKPKKLTGGHEHFAAERIGRWRLQRLELCGAPQPKSLWFQGTFWILLVIWHLAIENGPFIDYLHIKHGDVQ